MKAQRKKVLVADCHEDVLIVLEKLLEDAGFDTTTAWSATDALKLLDSNDFDLVLINKYLPEARCEELLKELDKRGESMPRIVMLPERPAMNDFTRLEALGAGDVVCKYAYRQVVESVRKCLVRGRKPLSAA